MNVVFVSNYINHHQIPVSQVLQENCKKDGGEYLFIQTEPMEEERVKMGWADTLKMPDFVRFYWENESECQQKIDEADVVIFGGCEDEKYIENRLESGKPIWRYSERVYKTGRWKFITPRGLKKKFHDHTRHMKKRVYLLCSGAYVAGDFRMFLAYPGKKYQYGYFPKFREYHFETLWNQKIADKEIRLLWAARMIDWKHPEIPVILAKELKEKGCSFHLTMLGDGEKASMVRDLVKQYGLEDMISLPGFCNPEETREYMERSHIYLATSDRQEGWGAVINEAMNSGMVVVANQDMGAAKSLITSGRDGVLYKNSEISHLAEKVYPFIQDIELCKSMGKEAYKTISELWNAQVAAERLYACMKAEYTGQPMPVYENGPLSRDQLWSHVN